MFLSYALPDCDITHISHGDCRTYLQVVYNTLNTMILRSLIQIITSRRWRDGAWKSFEILRALIHR